MALDEPTKGIQKNEGAKRWWHGKHIAQRRCREAKLIDDSGQDVRQSKSSDSMAEPDDGEGPERRVFEQTRYLTSIPGFVRL